MHSSWGSNELTELVVCFSVPRHCLPGFGSAKVAEAGKAFLLFYLRQRRWKLFHCMYFQLKGNFWFQVIFIVYCFNRCVMMYALCKSAPSAFPAFKQKHQFYTRIRDTGVELIQQFFKQIQPIKVFMFCLVHSSFRVQRSSWKRPSFHLQCSSPPLLHQPNFFSEMRSCGATDNSQPFLTTESLIKNILEIQPRSRET